MSFFSKRIFNFGAKKKDGPDGLWIKCTSCAEMLYKSDLENAHWVCNKCDYHFVLAREDRLKMMVEPNSFEEWDNELSSVDKLGFTGKDSYASKLKENVSKTGHHDAITSGKAMMGHHPVALGIMDFKFLGASMGAVVGEKITRLIERATEERMPAIVVCASGGARMYEGLFSLMQMAKTSAACARHAQAGLPYIPVLTHPTMAGVMASFATLGDLIIAEPNALIGFAGPRVIKETTQQDLPEGFQRSEFLLEHGLLDMVIHRRDLKSQLVEVLDYMMPEGPLAEPTTQTEAS